MGRGGASVLGLTSTSAASDASCVEPSEVAEARDRFEVSVVVESLGAVSNRICQKLHHDHSQTRPAKAAE